MGLIEEMQKKIDYLESVKSVHAQELEIIKSNQDVFNNKLEVVRNGFNKIGGLLNDIYRMVTELKDNLEEEEEEECDEEDCPDCKSTAFEKEALDRLCLKAKEFKDLLNSMTKKE